MGEAQPHGWGAPAGKTRTLPQLPHRKDQPSLRSRRRCCALVVGEVMRQRVHVRIGDSRVAS
jgi:hypothetical protein